MHHFVSTSFAGLGLLLLLTPDLDAQSAWSQVVTSNRPSRGLWPGMAFATVTGKCYLYGGADGVTTGTETWEYDGTDWMQLFPPTDPGERHTFGICYDEARSVIVMFGGSDNAFNTNGETWEYDPVANTWTQRMPLSGVGPTPRYGCRMVYDTLRGVSVLYGGWSGFGFTNETWEWDGADWTQVTTANLPSPRDRFAFAFDLARGKAVLFGGISAAPSDETWEYDGIDWTQINTPTTPPARQKVYMAYDPVRGMCVMQGGQANAVQLLDSWEYDGVNWRLVASTPTPARGENATTYDLARGRVVVFGGYSITGTLTETWEYGAVATPRFHAFGTGCTGSGGVPVLRATPGTSPALGTTFSMDVVNLPAAGGVGYLFAGVSNYQLGPIWLPFDTGAIGWNGCTAYLAPAGGVFFNHAAGVGSVPVMIPNNALLASFTFYVQALSFDALAQNGQVALSNGGEIIVN